MSASTATRPILITRSTARADLVTSVAARVKQYEREHRIAVEMLLSHRINLGNRKAVRRALDRANVVPVTLRRYHPVYETFVTYCMAVAKAERLERLLRKGLH
jgi:hypothetical protein